jgi:hypothetical protein
MRRFTALTIVALAVCSLMPAAQVQAETVTLRQGLNGYTGTVDLYIQSSQANSNFASDAVVDLWGNSISGTGFTSEDTSVDFRQGLLRFDDLFADLPAGAVITSAQLTVNIVNPAEELHVFRMTTDWSVSGATAASWNFFDGDGNGADNGDAPNQGGGITVGVDTIVTPEFVGPDQPDATTGPLNIDVTATVQAWFGGADNFGWAFMMENLNRGQFTSSEGLTEADRPTLAITFTVIPEPTSLIGLAGVGGAMLMRRRRRAD